MTQPIKRGRGRPRPLEVIQRDDSALRVLQDAGEIPMTRDAVADALECTKNQAYLSLCRLRAEGLVRRHNNAWIAQQR